MSTFEEFVNKYLIKNSDDDIAPVKEEDEGEWYENFFKRGGLFEDGYQEGDILNTAGATAADFGVNVLKGGGRLVEGITDLGGHLIASGADLIGQDEWSNNFRDKVNASWVDAAAKPADEYLDQYSVLGSTSEAVAEGVGQVATLLLTGGVLGAAGASTGAVSTATNALIGLSSMGSGISEAYLGGATDKQAWSYGAMKGAIDAGTEMIFGGLGRAVKALGFSKGLLSLDDMLAKGLSKRINNRVLKNLVELGVKASAEGLEELMAGFCSAIAKKFTYMNEEDFNTLLQNENLLEQFVVGAITSGVMQSGLVPGTKKGSFRETVKNDQDFVTRLDTAEQTVVDKIYNDRLTEAEQSSEKVTAKEKNKIYDNILKELDNGRIRVEDIESAFGGSAIAKIMVKGTKLAESYNERARRGEYFKANISQYAANQREVVKKAMEAGFLNDTRATHEFVDMVAKISADKGITFDFTNNQKLRASGFSVRGSDINAYVNKAEGIVVNMDSVNAMQAVVGHEITHVLEGTPLYDELRSVLFNYAKSKGDFQERYNKLEQTYKGIDNTTVEKELAADLVGEYLFSDEDFVKHLSVEHKNIFIRIYEEIKYLWKLVTAGSKEARQLEKAKHIFDKVYKQMGSVGADTRFSLNRERAIMADDLNETESKVAEKVFNDRVAQAEKKSKTPLTNEQKYDIFLQVVQDLEDGKFKTDDIWNVVAADNNARTSRKLIENSRLANSYARESEQRNKRNQTIEDLSPIEKLVVDRIYEDDVAKASKNGERSISQDEKDKIMDKVLKNLEKGNLDAKTILHIAGGKKSTQTELTRSQIQKADQLIKNTRLYNSILKESQRINDTENAYANLTPEKRQIADYYFNKRLWEAAEGGNKTVSWDERDRIKAKVLTDISKGKISMDTLLKDESSKDLSAPIRSDTKFSLSEKMTDDQKQKARAARRWQTLDSLTVEENSVVDKIYNDRIAKAENGGKKQLTQEEKYKIFTKVVDDYEKLSTGRVNKTPIADSNGNTLHAEQIEYFKNSKVRDKEGNLLAVYSKTNKSTIGADHAYMGTSFTDNIATAISQAKGKFDSSGVDVYYLNMQNPIDFTNISKDAFKDVVEVLGGDVDAAEKVYKKARADERDILGLLNKMRGVEGVDIYNSRDTYKNFTNELKSHYKKLMAKGYDGVIGYINGWNGKNAEKEYIVLNNNQAQLSTNELPISRKNTKFSLSENLDRKQAQYSIIEESNPAPNSYNTWIRSANDIKTLAETLEDSDWADITEFDPDLTRADIENAIERGKITVYSSYPIENGVFVTPSRMEAKSYSADGKVYQKMVNVDDVAWIDPTQGQYASVNDTQYSLTPKGEKPRHHGDYYTPLKDLKIDKDMRREVYGTNTQRMIDRNKLNASAGEDEIFDAPIAPEYENNTVADVTKTRNIVDSEIGAREKPTLRERVKKAVTKARTHLVDNYSVFEDLALETGNRELDAKANFMRYSEQRAQNFIGKGADGVRSIEDLRQEVKDSGLNQEFQEYMYDMLNTDRMTLEKRAKSMLREVGKQFKDVKLDRIKAIAAKTITPQTSAKTTKTIRAAREYVNLLELKNKPVRGMNYTDDISKANTERLEALHPEFKRWAQDVYKINDYLREKLVQDGEISRETADFWARIYPHYVPIRRLDNSGNAVGDQYVQQVEITPQYNDGDNVGINAPIKRATGGRSDIDDLFRTLAMRAEQTFKAGAKNKFGVELKNTLETTIDSRQASFDEMIDGVETYEERVKKSDDGTKYTFTVFEDGERVEFEITDEMYEALQPANDLFSGTFKPLNTISNIQKNVLTQYNPFFTVRNIAKDAQDVFINSRHARRTYAKMPEAVNELFKYGRGETTKWAKEYFESGGDQNTYFDNRELKFKKEDGIFKKVLGFIPRKIGEASNFFEMVPRLSEYIASRESGESIESSMLDAARVTTNFAAGGDVTKWANRNGVTFLNASVQGTAQQVRNIREAKANGLKGMMKLGAKFVAAGLPFVLLNALMWDDDEDYENLSDYVKEDYYIIAKYGDGQFVRIPKGRAMAVIQNGFEEMRNLITGDDEADFERFGELLVDYLVPNNPLENNVFAPIADVLQNKTWYGEDLVPSRLQDVPEAEQYDETTDSISKWLGEVTNTSPYKWNYALDQYSGVIGDILLPMLTPQAEGGDNSLLGNIIAPLKNEFATDSVLKNQNVADFYDTVDSLTKNENSKYATTEDILKYKYMNSVRSELSDLYKQKREIQNSNLSDEVKYQAVRNIQKQIDEIAENSLESYDNMRTFDGYAIVGGKFYNTHASELQKITADKDASGKTISGSRKKKVIAYINNLDIPYEDKLILYKSEYPSDQTYNTAIVNYLNGRDDISYDEMVSILQGLGFTIKGDRITWN